MSKEKLKAILSNYEEKITERKIAKLSRRIRWARIVIALIFVLNLVAFTVIFNKGYTDYFQLSIAGAFLILFLLSAAKPLIFITAAAILDIGLTIYRFANAFNAAVHGDMTEGAAFRITMIAVGVHLIFITYLIMGIIAAKKFEAIEEE